ncbi:OmpA family protein [Candidatus Berkiella cookevillensis]|uniref:Motility protein B n=1 Tax=Candidatus Berkiella cookevillensis TaxID=437022 RepID=A0A0Q9Y9A8_9GAMM|nr:flagellar motor protein MotB [Candidatus Berkiella cookevillensis]MCS5707756.1 OmpA family protein [Candidatus Berkiella cookevillensis]
MISNDIEDVAKLEKPGVPAWVVTFGNLMSLLMCFFVLQLSFSQIETEKFKKIAISMVETFGARQEGGLDALPQEVRAIARGFNPSNEASTLNEVKTEMVAMPNQVELDEAIFEKVKEKKKKEREEKSEQAAIDIAKQLVNEILNGTIEIEPHEQHIVIRILEQDSFFTGENEVRASFMPILNKIRRILEHSDGNISIEVHTDDLPVFTSDFRSNWDLSVVRAASVAHLLLNNPNSTLDKKRVSILGHADSKPLFANDSKAHRASNRRIEIILDQNTTAHVNNMSHELNQEKLTKEFKSVIVPALGPVLEKKVTSIPSAGIKRSIPKNQESMKDSVYIEPAKPIKSQEVDQKFLLHD